MIHIGDAKTNTWRDGDVMLVRTEDGTFSTIEHRFPFAVIPLRAMAEVQAREFERPGAGRRRRYMIDWKSLIAGKAGTVDGKDATEADVLDSKKKVVFAQQNTSVVKVR